MSRYLQELNDDQIKEGDFVYSLFSGQDDLIGYENLVWGRYTSVWPTTDTYKNYNYDVPCHMGLRDQTAPDQYSLITRHSFNTSEKKASTGTFLSLE